MRQHSPHALAHAIKEARMLDGGPEIENVRVNCGQVLVTIRPGVYVHVHPSSSLSKALSRIAARSGKSRDAGGEEGPDEHLAEETQ